VIRKDRMIFSRNIEASDAIRIFFIVVAIIMFRKVAASVIIKIIKKFTGKSKIRNIDLAIDSLEKPLLNLITYTAVYLGIIDLPFTAEAYLFINKLYRTCIIIIAAQFMLRFVTAYTDWLSGNFEGGNQGSRIQVTRTMFPILSKLIKIVIVIVTVVAVAVEFDFRQLSSILAGLGIGGAALALASQDLMKNFFGGFVILTEKTFSIGDWIKIDSFEGTVEELGLRSTKIRTFNKELVVVPNARFADREIMNSSLRENRRVSFILGVSYGTAMDKMEILIDRIKYMLNSHVMVKEESAIVVFSNFGPDSLEISVHYYTNTSVYAEYMSIMNDVNFKIMEILSSEGIDFALPRMNIYINEGN